VRELIGFDGAVECRAESGPINLVLRGFERGVAGAPRTAAAALFSGAALPMSHAAVPARLHGASLLELEGAPGQCRYLLRAEELQLELRARSLQLHRAAGRELFSAVPSPRVPWRLRVGWTVLLDVLRLPGVARLLLRRRDGA
jgi:hypothetical protein